MASKNDGFLKKLLATLKVEADGHLKAMSSGLVALEKIPAGEQRTELVEKIFREAHSLEGAARAVNFTQIAASSQQQMVGMDQVALAMENIKQASVQNVAGTRQAEVAAQSLHELGSRLKQIAAQYKV